MKTVRQESKEREEPGMGSILLDEATERMKANAEMEAKHPTGKIINKVQHHSQIPK